MKSTKLYPGTSNSYLVNKTQDSEISHIKYMTTSSINTFMWTLKMLDIAHLQVQAFLAYL